MTVEETIEKYSHLPIIVAGESMADFCGWTSTGESRMLYIGNPKYEETGELRCIGTEGYEGNSPVQFKGYNLRLMSNVEIVRSLLEFDCSQWGYRALCHAVMCLKPEVRWLEDVINRRLYGTLIKKLLTAIELNEADSFVFEMLNDWQILVEHRKRSKK